MILTLNLNPAIDKVYAVDDFAVNRVFRPRDMTATAGGKGLNVARVARLLGSQVTASGFLGGNNGSFIAAKVQEEGIKEEFVRIAGESRITIAVMDQKNHTSTEILEPGPEITTEESNAFLQHYQALLDNETMAVVTASGSLPRGLPVDFYRTLITIAREKGKKFILDTSGAYLKSGLEGRPYMIKPNQDELAVLFGKKAPTLTEQARALLLYKEKGVQLPCLTLGRDGCLAALEDGLYHFSAPPLEVLNTVGSGDAFVAGCAVALARGQEPAAAIRLGMACGMANTQFFQTGMISLELVERFLPLIAMEKMSV